MLDDKPRFLKMADKLQIEIDNGRLAGDFAESFIPQIRGKLKRGFDLSPREAEVLEDLFGKS